MEKLQHLGESYCAFVDGKMRELYPKRERFVLLIACIVSISGAILGYEETSTCLLSSSHSSHSHHHRVQGYVDLQILSLGYLGIGIGAVLSLPFADMLGRRYTLIYSALAHIT